jgi:hypothetical protein
MNENGSGARMKSKNQKEEFDDEKVREIIEMEFDSLEEWKDVELTKLREDYKNKVYSMNITLDKNVKNNEYINNSYEDNECN